MTLTNERVCDDNLDLESLQSSGSPRKSRTKDDNETLHYSSGLLQRGDTDEIPLKESELLSSRTKKKNKRRNRDGTTVSRRSATRESRGERARSLSRGLRRSLSKLRTRSKSALRRATTDKLKKKPSRGSDVNEQPQTPNPDVRAHSAVNNKLLYSVPDRSTSVENTSNNNEDDSVASNTLDHDSGKGLQELFERQQKELQLEMSASIARFDNAAKYWRKRAKALKEKYEGESKLERNIKDNEKESGERIKDLEIRLKTLGEEKEELKRQLNSSSQQAFVLEQKVKDRDSSIAQLRHMMEKSEEDSESRIELLERQLEKLVEMKSSRPDNVSTSQATLSASTATLSMSQTLSASQTSYTSNANTENSHKSGDKAVEIKSLEALLVRILAEKDKLAFENENLRALVAQNEPSSKPVALANSKTYQLSCRNCIDQSFVGQTKDDVKQKVRDHFSEGKSFTDNLNLRFPSPFLYLFHRLTLVFHSMVCYQRIKRHCEHR